MTTSELLSEINTIANATLPTSGNITDAQIKDFYNKVNEHLTTTVMVFDPDARPYPTTRF